MRNFRIQIVFCILLGLVVSQPDLYRSVEDIQTEWTGYTSFQKEEMVSFCDFLFNEGYYERCLLTSFQIIYKFPNDPNIPIIKYYIARSYEEIGSYELAHSYYDQVKAVAEPGTIIYKAVEYRKSYINLISGEVDELLENTQKTEDPYLLAFRGYAHMNKMEWEDARASFISAQSRFSHPHYDELMSPIYQAIENVHTVPRHNKYLVLFSGALFPGGGQFMLKEWNKGQGIFSSVGLMLLIGSWAKVDQLIGKERLLDNVGTSIPIYKNYKQENFSPELTKNDKIPTHMNISDSSIRYLIPPLAIGAGVFLGSSWKSFRDTNSKNKKLVEYYIQDRIEKISPERFIDFPEPKLITPR
tara:strand:+ start:1094 stop:2164 length:1071 start_codon:yes stop_codon:yes gene_type:complete